MGPQYFQNPFYDWDTFTGAMSSLAQGMPGPVGAVARYFTDQQQPQFPGMMPAHTPNAQPGINEGIIGGIMGGASQQYNQRQTSPYPTQPPQWPSQARDPYADIPPLPPYLGRQQLQPSPENNMMPMPYPYNQQQPQQGMMPMPYPYNQQPQSGITQLPYPYNLGITPRTQAPRDVEK